MAQLTGFSSQLKFKLTDDQKKWLISLKSGPKKATGVGFNGGYLKDMRLSGIIEIAQKGKVMTWGPGPEYQRVIPCVDGSQSWQEYFLSPAELAASRSHCLHRKVGAVLVKDRRVIATGYNGPASGLPHCEQCRRMEPGKELEDCYAVHAEENAIIQVAVHGLTTEGSTLYCTHQPCFHCAKLIIQAKVRNVVYAEPYPDDRGLELLKKAKIEVTKLE